MGHLSSFLVHRAWLNGAFARGWPVPLALSDLEARHVAPNLPVADRHGKYGRVALPGTPPNAVDPSAGNGCAHACP
jgi:hypothetical protein